jgi:hypothetical protein
MRKTRERETIGDNHTMIYPSVPIAAATIPVPLFTVETAKQSMWRQSSRRGRGAAGDADQYQEQDGKRSSRGCGGVWYSDGAQVGERLHP